MDKVCKAIQRHAQAYLLAFFSSQERSKICKFIFTKKITSPGAETFLLNNTLVVLEAT